jgi:hypothetical protein
VKPFFAEGSTISIREFVVGALHNEMGLEASADPDLLAASEGGRVVTPSGMVLDGLKDKISVPPAPDDQNGNEIDPSLVDHLEFYLLNYFKPAHSEQNAMTEQGRRVLSKVGCSSCHIPDLTINHDRRVADVETVYEPLHGIFNNLFATASTLYYTKDDGRGFPPLKGALGEFICGERHIHGLQEARLGCEFLRAQLGRHTPYSVLNAPPLGSRLHEPVRT